MAAEWYLAAKQKPQSCLNSTVIFFSVSLCAGTESLCWMMESWPSPLHFCSDQIRFQITALLFLLMIYGCSLSLTVRCWAVYVEDRLHAQLTLGMWKTFSAESKCRGRSWPSESGCCAFMAQLPSQRGSNHIFRDASSCWTLTPKKIWTVEEASSSFNSPLLWNH